MDCSVRHLSGFPGKFLSLVEWGVVVYICFVLEEAMMWRFNYHLEAMSRAMLLSSLEIFLTIDFFGGGPSPAFIQTSSSFVGGDSSG